MSSDGKKYYGSATLTSTPAAMYAMCEYTSTAKLFPLTRIKQHNIRSTSLQFLDTQKLWVSENRLGKTIHKRPLVTLKRPTNEHQNYIKTSTPTATYPFLIPKA